MSDGDTAIPNDIVAVFHASFHPTEGNIIDWSLTADDSIRLDNIEFSALPSGLHLVEQDVIYLTKHGHSGICIFKRRLSSTASRGFLMSSLGILVAKSARPRPWRHRTALMDLIMVLYTKMESRGTLEPFEEDWEPVREFFEQRRVRPSEPSMWGAWRGWSFELDSPESDLAALPTMHLSHMLRILGPSCLTLFKHILGRRRILIYTLPPVEAACILCHVAADMCLDYQLSGKSGAGVHVLGMVTLNDLDMLRDEGKTGRGWLACTTDAIFLEKPEHYDLLVDLTTSTPNKATRPTLSVSRPISPTPPRGPKHKLSTIRFVWSDVRLWTEVDRLLKRDSGEGGGCSCSSPPTEKSRTITAWTDAWRVYEDVCLICAGLWMGSWRGNSTASYSSTSAGGWGSVRLDGDDDLTVGSTVRQLGQGIEGRRAASESMSRTPPMSPKAFAKSRKPNPQQEQEEQDRRQRQVLTTLAILQTFHAHTCFQLSQLERLLAKAPSSSDNQYAFGDSSTVILTAKDVLSFELGPLSGLDARYLGWLAEEYAPGRKVVTKTGWRDILGLVIGFG